MMRPGTILIAVAATLFGAAAFSQAGTDPQVTAAPKGPPPLPPPLTRSARPAANRGEAMFLEHCAMCHGLGAMGTGLLGRRVKPALLEERRDLDRDYVIQAVRGGIGNMPPIPRGEVSDAALGQIADYLTRAPGGAQ